ncbi:ASCH domain-containing protein [Mycobacterium sp. NPDC048908]|uniref:ASCH domain-containing protein n=1 Tax=Mycobacterium sp. NPDC048908 TaxID=3364292 RepID=UPI003711F612
MRSLDGSPSPFPGNADRVRPSDHGAEPAGRAREFGPRGLIVRDPYATQLLNGQKIWEIRGRPTQIRGPVVIVKQGTGKAYGIANLVRVLGPLDLDDLVSSPEVPSEERDELQRNGLPYRKTYAYVFTSPRSFRHPLPYRHPNGAVTWVRLPDLDLDNVEYVAPAERELV